MVNFRIYIDLPIQRGTVVRRDIEQYQHHHQQQQ